MQRRRLGGLEVSAVGLGCATMTPFYDQPDPESAQLRDADCFSVLIESLRLVVIAATTSSDLEAAKQLIGCHGNRMVLSETRGRQLSLVIRGGIQ